MYMYVCTARCVLIHHSDSTRGTSIGYRLETARVVIGAVLTSTHRMGEILYTGGFCVLIMNARFERVENVSSLVEVYCSHVVRCL